MIDRWLAAPPSSVARAAHGGRHIVRPGDSLVCNVRWQVLKKTEPNNAALHHAVSVPFARLAGRDKITLLLTMRLIERARDIDPTNEVYATECASQAVMLGELDTAMKMYKRSVQLDDKEDASDIAAIEGMIHVYILQGNFQDAQDQLEFFSVMEESVGRTPQKAFLDAMMAWAKEKDEAKHMKLLKEVQDLHWKAVKKAQERGVTKNTIECVAACCQGCLHSETATRDCSSRKLELNQ